MSIVKSSSGPYNRGLIPVVEGWEVEVENTPPWGFARGIRSP